MKMTKIAAIVAAAALLIIGAAFTSMAADKGWVLEEDGWTFQDSEGGRYSLCFKASGDNYYWLDDEGVMATEQLVSTDTGLYYVDATGARVKNTWVKVYDEDAEADYWYYFGTLCKAVTGKKTCPVSNGATATATYFFDVDKHMLTGWVNGSGDPIEYTSPSDDDNIAYQSGTYYCGEADDGAMVVSDWRKLEIASSDGTTEKWFYFGSNGKKYTNTNVKKIDGKTYSFSQHGVMASGTWSNDDPITTANFSTYRRYDETGALVTGWFKATAPEYDEDSVDEITEYWYYADSKGVLANYELRKLSNGKYYGFNAASQMLTGLNELTFSGSTLKFAAAPSEATDWTGDLAVSEWSTDAETATLDGFYYFGSSDDADIDGAMKTGDVEITLNDTAKTLSFLTSGAKGRARNGYDAKGKKYYTNGIKLAASADEIVKVFKLETGKYVAADLDDIKTSAKAGLYKNFGKTNVELYAYGTSVVYSTATGATIVPNGIPAASSPYVAFNTSGTVVTATKENGDGYKVEIGKAATGVYKVTGIYYIY